MSSGGRKGTKTNDGAITKKSNSAEDGLKKGPWMESEDAILADYVGKNGEGNWNSVRKNTGLLRCGKSCRLRWSNHLKPDLKKIPFSIEEEALIVDLHSKLGNKWARMASELPGRTDNEIKNFWNTRIKRRQRSGLSHQFQQQQDGVINQSFANQPITNPNPVFQNQTFYPNPQNTQFNFRPPFRLSTPNWLNPNLDNFKPIPLVQPPLPLVQYGTAAPNHALGSYTTMMMGAIDNNSLPTGLPSIQTPTATTGDGNGYGNGDHIGMMKSFSTNSNNFYDTCDLLNAVVRDVTSSPQRDTSKRVILFEDEGAEQGAKRFKQSSLSDDLQATASGESLMNMPNLTSSQSSIGGGGGMETSEEMKEEMNSTDEDDLTHLLDFSYSPLPDWYRKRSDDNFM